MESKLKPNETLYLIFLYSKHLDKDTKKLCEYSSYTKLEENLVAYIEDNDEIYTSLGVTAVRDRVYHTLGTDTYVMVVKCGDNFDAAWFLTPKSSEWLKQYM